eukprot:11210197-Alexandrium_andersonii.AAC.1
MPSSESAPPNESGRPERRASCGRRPARGNQLRQAHLARDRLDARRAARGVAWALQGAAPRNLTP